jgi:hypothetical protein
VVDRLLPYVVVVVVSVWRWSLLFASLRLARSSLHHIAAK